MTRSLTLLVVPADNPDEIDRMSFRRRREESGGWERMEVCWAGWPDALLRQALELDPGVYASPRAWDDGCVVVTSFIAPDGVKDAADVLASHLSQPEALAARLIGHARSEEDARRVARAATEELAETASGPAEEAARYTRIFMKHVPYALSDRCALVWEQRTEAPCECAVWEGQVLGQNLVFPRPLFETLQDGASGTLRCSRCRSTLAFSRAPWHVDVKRLP